MTASPTTVGNPFLDKAIINSFIEIVSEVFSSHTKTPVTCGKVYIEKSFNIHGDLAGIIAMTGGTLKGTLSVSFPQSAILHIMENQLGQKYQQLSKATHDSVGEYTSLIYRVAIDVLKKHGYKFDPALPTVIPGHFAEKMSHHGVTLIIPMRL